MRAVVDTNVIVSGLLSPKGNARLVLALTFARKFDLVLFEELLAEYEAVLRRPKFRFRANEVDETLGELRRVGEVVKPIVTVSESPDQPDNRFLECAEAGAADYLVTGNTPRTGRPRAGEPGLRQELAVLSRHHPRPD